MRLRLGVKLCLFLSNQGVHCCVYIYVCVSVCETVCVTEENVLKCICICTGGVPFCDSRHHADLISVITACQPGALGTSVKLFCILLSALNVFVFFIFQLSVSVY